VRDIYYQDYWIASGANNLSPPLDIVHFDTAVHSGPGQAQRFLQQVTDTEPCSRAERYLQLREEYLRKIVSKNSRLQVFMRGWMNRLNSLRTQVQNHPRCRQPSRSYQDSLSLVGFFTSGSVGCGAAPCTQLYANSTAPAILTKDWRNKVIDKLVQSARGAWSGTKNATLKGWNWGKKEVVKGWNWWKKEVVEPIWDLGKWLICLKKGAEKKGATPPPKVQHQYNDGEYTEAVLPSPSSPCKSKPKGGEIIFVNGILNSPGDHDKSKQEIADAFCRPVRGIYNASEGFVRDLGQAIGDGFWPLSASLFGGGGKNQATISLYNEIYRKLENNEEVRIVAHSQGAIILWNALSAISLTFGREKMKKIKVITMGSPVFAPISLRWMDYKQWVIGQDPVARLGAPSYYISQLDRNVSWYRAPDISTQSLCDYVVHYHSVSTYLHYKDNFALPDSWEEER
jgi:hypothetical protein